jgi:hypothetical protein
MVAIHEAGHAVTSHVLGRRVLSASIVRGEWSAGRVTYYSSRRSSKMMGGRSVRTIEREIMVNLAGAEAAHQVCNDHLRVERGTRDDYEHAFELAALLSFGGFLDPDEARARVAWLRVRARNLVTEPLWWSAMSA